MKTLKLALLGIALLGSSSAALAADAQAGKIAYEKFACAACHGADGKTATLPSYPILAGQHEDYLRHALNSYKRGQANLPATSNLRKNAVMGALVGALSSADIANIAAWLASQPSDLGVRK